MAGIILLAAPTRPIPEMMLEQEKYIVGFHGNTPDEQTALDELAANVAGLRNAIDTNTPYRSDLIPVPVGCFRDLEAHDPAKIMADLGKPCLILQGGRDYQVTLDDFAGWKAALRGRDFACLRVFDDLDHLLRPAGGPPARPPTTCPSLWPRSSSTASRGGS